VTALEKLVMMANQIAMNQQHEPDPVTATANHILLFWDPRMKAMILGHGVEGLNETAKAALESLGQSG
jgi:formate dehydrogenase subunit delta